MADGSAQSQWRYEFKKSDPASAKAAYEELLHDEEDPLTLIDIDDDCSSAVNGIFVYRNDNEEVIPCSGDIQIDFKKLQFTVPEELKEFYQLETSEVPAKNLRYVGLPHTGKNAEENDGTIALLSLWKKDRDVLNMNITCSETKQSVLLLNALSRLIYEAFGQSSVRTHKFYAICEGPVDVAWCTVDERDERDAWKQSKEADKDKSTGDKSTLEKDAADENDEKKERKEFPQLQRSPMYFTVDEEAILLFQHPFSAAPLHDFRFYREATKKSIDTIYVCNSEDQLEIQQGDNVFFILPRRGNERSSKCYEELVNILRDGTVKPKSEEAFTGSGGAFSKIFSADDKSSDDMDDIVPIKPGSQMQQQSGIPLRNTTRSNESGAYGQSRSWLSNLNSGEHLINVSEDMQMMWFTVEPELEQLIVSDAVPESDMHSSGLDPNSVEHLQTAVESIRDKLLSESYGEAISHLRGILKLYGETLLAGAAVVDRVSEVDLLKRIYFLA